MTKGVILRLRAGYLRSPTELGPRVVPKLLVQASLYVLVHMADVLSAAINDDHPLVLELSSLRATVSRYQVHHPPSPGRVLVAIHRSS